MRPFIPFHFFFLRAFLLVFFFLPLSASVARGDLLQERAVLSGHSAQVWSLAFSPNGKVLASAGGDPSCHSGEIILWDLATATLSARSNERRIGWHSLAFTPDGRRLLTSGSRDSSLKLRDASTGRPLALLHGPGQLIYGVAIAPDGKMAAVVGGDGPEGVAGEIMLWDLSSRTMPFALKAHRGAAYCAAFSPEGRTLATGGQEGTARLWSAAFGTERMVLRGHTKTVYRIAFSPDGKTVATASADQTIKLWETSSGKERATLRGHTGEVMACAFSPDGAILATAGGDLRLHRKAGEIRLWNLTTLHEIAHRPAGCALVLSIAFSPDGRTLASGDERMVKLWNVKLPPPSEATHSLTAKELDADWNALAGDDAARAYQGIRRLTHASRQSIAFLQAHLPPAEPPDSRTQKRIERLLTELDDDSYQTRENATRELARQGRIIEPALQRLLSGGPSLEARRRAETVLQRRDGPITEREHLRGLRAVEVLERIGPPARELLTRLATGFPDAPLTRAAKAALQRMRH